LFVAAAVLATSAIASASPKTPKAKSAFSAGVKAYQAHNYALASKYLEKSFAFERDVETLFAWAQAERQLEHCDKASELYVKILTFEMPPANKQAVQAKLQECKETLVTTKPEPEPVVGIEPKPEPAPVEPRPPPEPTHEPRARWKDPIGLSLVGLGVIGTAIGTGYLVAGSSANSQSTTFEKTSRGDYLHYQDLAKTDGERGVIALAVGGGLLVAGIIRFATHHASSDESQVSAWISPSGSGLALGGRF
jgi:hypothetical protein